MKPEFYDAYRDLADLYRISERYPRLFPPFRRTWDIKIVNDAIDNETQELGLQERLNPDARLFLLINFHQMVVLPLSYVRPSQIPRDAMERALRDDVRTILKAAQQDAESSEQREISGHSIVNVLADVWSKLRVTGFEVWG